MSLSRREIREFWDDVSMIDSEKKIEQAVNSMLKRYFQDDYSNVETSFEGNTDGVIRVSNPPNLFEGNSKYSDEFSILVETKLDVHFTGDKGKNNRSIVLAQVVYYLRKSFYDEAKPLPNAVIVSDKNEIFAIPSYYLKDFVENNEYDWSIAPSQAAYKNPRIVSDLNDSKNLNIYVEALQKEYFDPNAFCDRVKQIALNANRNNDLIKIKVDHDNLEKAFLEFQHQVFKGKTNDTKTQMMIFIKTLLGDDTIYLHPTRKNVLLVESRDHKNKVSYDNCIPKKLPFSSGAYELFFTKYDKDHYSLDERKAITEIADTLFEEFDRRFTGDFWTPKVWVDKAHEYIENTLGRDWKDEYVVWDASCGSKNLTRDYKFRELYSSTLHQDELNIAEDYNRESMAFQYDFLNDDIDLHLAYDSSTLGVDVSGREWKMPGSLIQALQDNKPIVFFMNPPYGQGSDDGFTDKKGITNNNTRNHMIKHHFGGHAARELYTQFMYRVQLLAETFGYTNDFHVFLFTNKTFLTGKKFKTFRDNYYTKFEYENGFMLNAGEFKGTSSNWGVVFTGWSLKNNPENLNMKLEVLETNSMDIIETKTQWRVKEVNKNLSHTLKTNETKHLTGFPKTSNGYSVTNGRSVGKTTRTAIGYLHNNGCNVQYSDKFTGLYSMCFLSGQGDPVTPENYEHICEAFAIRKSCHQMIKETDLLWVLDKDVFPVIPEENRISSEFNTFSSDCVVYSLFGRGSNQTSLRNYEYGKDSCGDSIKWRVKNEFFWLSPQELRAYCDEYRDVSIISDLVTDSASYTRQYLESTMLSQEASELMSIANQIIKESMPYRLDYAEMYPKYNLMSWDAGWNQIYRMCYSRDAHPMAKQNTKLQELYEDFSRVFSILEAKIAFNYMKNTNFATSKVLHHAKTKLEKPQEFRN